MTGRLAGIARHCVSRGPIETLEQVAVTREQGVTGHYRGALKPGRNKRQVSLIEAESWALAMAELGESLEWWNRRANLLLSGLRLPREPGFLVRIGEACVIEVTGECDPCKRMDELRPGLMNALMPDWRGGFTGRVICDGHIALGDEVRIG
jgi:MOSC domain-containing protein YiiM